MIKSFIATAAVAVLGFASAANAHHWAQQPFVEAESQLVLNAVRATGHNVLLNQGPCQEKDGLMGFATMNGFLVICAENHKGDMDELADTIRHEALHLAQFCKARRTGEDLLFPEHEDSHIELAQTELHWHILGYDTEQWAREAEARVAAQVLDEYQVAQIIRQECS